MMDALIMTLRSGNHSLVVDNGELRAFDGRGIADLYDLLLNHPAFLKGSRIADKVVGKGAAALMIIGGVASVYAEVISTPALQFFKAASIDVAFGKSVPNIANRNGTGICPVEQMCLGCATPEECLPLISAFLASKSPASNHK